jgi:hypothetical protein
MLSRRTRLAQEAKNGKKLGRCDQERQPRFSATDRFISDLAEMRFVVSLFFGALVRLIAVDNA